MNRLMPTTPEWLRSDVLGRPVGVDREAKVIRGYIVAEEGLFKTPGRGKFSSESLAKIVSLMSAKAGGTKSRFTHPGLSSDGLGKHLGRAQNPRLDGKAVRADLHLSDAAFSSPEGNLGAYIMDLAESDPEAFGSSLVLQVDKSWDLDAKGDPIIYDAEGEEVSPLWMPTVIHASDVVDDGDAVHSGFLSAGQVDWDALPDAVQRQGWQALDALFAGQPREVCEARVKEYLARYLDNRYGREQTSAPGPSSASLRRRLRLQALGK